MVYFIVLAEKWVKYNTVQCGEVEYVYALFAVILYYYLLCAYMYLYVCNRYRISPNLVIQSVWM